MIEEESFLTPVDIIVSQTDVKGDIIYVNPIFCKISGFTNEELIGENHNIIRHRDMPKVIFKLLWSLLEEKEECYCFVKNRTRSGGFYWVFAYIRPALNKDGTVRNYISTRRVMSQRARAIIEPLYKELLSLENQYGVEVSEEKLYQFLEQNRYENQSNNEIMRHLQY